MNVYDYLRRSAAVLLLSTTVAMAAPVDRDTPREPIGIGDRIIRLIKKIPRPTIPKIFDDNLSIPKP